MDIVISSAALFTTFFASSTFSMPEAELITGLWVSVSVTVSYLVYAMNKARSKDK